MSCPLGSWSIIDAGAPPHEVMLRQESAQECGTVRTADWHTPLMASLEVV